ncbi:MAG: DUF2189 domain-containing protein [Pseudomonadota bacterium]
MTMDPQPATARPEIGTLRPHDLLAALRDGWRDFSQAPLYGLFFAATYVAAGLLLSRLDAGLFTWTLTLTLGFPLLAPFLAVGLYEVSRRLERGEALTFEGVLGVVWYERTRQVPWAGLAILLIFLFWSFLAHMLFALFMGPSALIGPPDDLRTYLSGTGLAMIAVELAFGAACAFLVFALTVIGLPLLLEREIDVITAMGISLRATRDNLPVMLLWAAIIATLTLLALLPWFTGLLIVLPVLGHASWHLYRRAVG